MSIRLKGIMSISLSIWAIYKMNKGCGFEVLKVELEKTIMILVVGRLEAQST